VCNHYTACHLLHQNMSNKGIPQTLATRQKISLANQKDRAKIDAKVKGYILSLILGDFPTLTDCAIHAGISEKTLIRYEITSPEDSDIREALDFIRDLSKSALIHGGLTRKFDARFSSFLLQASHNMNAQAPTLTQNNIFSGLTPELLAEALQLSREKKPLPPKV
jgi:thiamine pyrophosphokinase